MPDRPGEERRAFLRRSFAEAASTAVGETPRKPLTTSRMTTGTAYRTDATMPGMRETGIR